jgi:hypothetical protein
MLVSEWWLLNTGWVRNGVVRRSDAGMRGSMPLPECAHLGQGLAGQGEKDPHGIHVDAGGRFVQRDAQ